MSGKSKPKQLLNGSYLIESGYDRLIEKERIKILVIARNLKLKK